MNEQLKQVIENSRRIAFLGGAGLSTESGIPDFRSADGIYKAQTAYGHSPEVLLSHDFFWHNTEVFYDYYKKFLLYPDAKPNNAHRALAKLEADGKLTAVITQNIDGLHQAAGSKNVLELHGSVHRNYCTKCRKFYPMEYILESEGVPTCSCGGVIKPDVVLYGEGLDDDTVTGAIKAIAEADAMIIAGTSLTVYPAAGLIQYFRGRDLAVINLGDAGDVPGALIIHQKVGETLGQIKIR